MTKIRPVILCGGTGTRLWPVSRSSYPKQFSQLVGEMSLFQQAALRVQDPLFLPPTIITHADFRFIVTEQLAAMNIAPQAVMLEPDRRNTAPAVLAATLHAVAQDPDAILLVLPSDHLVPDKAAFVDAVKRGVTALDRGDMVTFGVTPDRPETGYGYLELARSPDDTQAAVPLTRFVEKPDASEAEKMVSEGAFLWNAGIFLFAASKMKAAFEAHAPDLIAPVACALQQAQTDLGFTRLAAKPWSTARDISIDYAVMEHTNNLSVVPYSADWSDLGSWAAVCQEMTKAANGVATQGPATAIDCSNTMLRAENPDQVVVGLGLKDVMVVATSDAVLVADTARTQEVGRAVKTLKQTQARQAEHFRKDHRPWGHYETLAMADRFQVKRIVVNPGGMLSLQSHHHRAEHWIIVAGTARVTIDDDVRLMSENESIYIPLGARHRLENPGKMPMVLIEVQTGGYLGEDDIVRYDDVYARG